MMNKIVSQFKNYSHQQLIILGLVVGVIFTIVSLITFAYFSFRQAVVVSPYNQEILPSKQEISEQKPNILSVALLGYGGGGHDGGLLTDSIIVVMIDYDREQINLISIPRDIWIMLPVKNDQKIGYKINAAYAIGSDDRNYRDKPDQFTGESGGGEMAKYALEQVLGYKVDRFIALDFAGFAKSIDVLGGVDIFVPVSFVDEFYPVEAEKNNTCGKSEEEMTSLTATLSGEKLEQAFFCRFEVLDFARGKTHMDGETALKYVRSRHSATQGGDFARSERQKSLILAVKDRVLSLNFIPKIIPFVGTLSYHVKTDFSADEMTQLVSEYEKLAGFEIKSIALSSKNVLKFGLSSNGQSILMPKEGEGEFAKLHEWVRDQVASSSATGLD